MSDLNLRQLQILFSEYLKLGAGSPEPEQIFKNSHGAGLRERLSVYQDGIALRLGESLAEDFPVTCKILSQEKFAELTRQYVRACPAHTWSVGEYSAGFPEFLSSILKESATGSEGTMPPGNDSLAGFLGDLASLEWKLILVEGRSKPEPFDFTRLAKFDAESLMTLKLVLNSGREKLVSPWPLLEIHSQETPPSDLKACADRPMNHTIMIYSGPGGVVTELLTASENLVLDQIENGSTLAELGDVLATHGFSETEVSKCFSKWVQSGLVTGVF